MLSSPIPFKMPKQPQGGQFSTLKYMWGGGQDCMVVLSHGFNQDQAIRAIFKWQNSPLKMASKFSSKKVVDCPTPVQLDSQGSKSWRFSGTTTQVKILQSTELLTLMFCILKPLQRRKMQQGIGDGCHFGVCELYFRPAAMTRERRCSAAVLIWKSLKR